VGALRDAGELGRAERVAREIDDPGLKVRALAAVLGAMVEAGQHRAEDLAGEAERLARATDAPFDQATAYLDIVGAMTAWATSRHVSTDDPLWARAHRLLGVLLAGPSWEEALGSLARLQPSALEAVEEALGQVTSA
jgi:hypothetical protein